MKSLFVLFFCLAFTFANAQSYIVKSIKSFGAKGDGITSDQDAFEKAAIYFNERGGNGKLLIPKGVYIVGRQKFTGGQLNKVAYAGENVMYFNNIQNFAIQGVTGSILKYKGSMRIGSFSPVTGEIYHPSKLPFSDRTYAAIPGNCITLIKSKGINISNINLDGNNMNMIIGGIYGDQGIQLQHYGIFIMNSQNVTVESVNVHHFGLDGISISNEKNSSPDSIKILNSSFEYNARQGLSWVGGNDLQVKNCKFNHTGRGKFSSSPGAGLDVEAEVGPIRNGVFDNCEFIDNTGPGVGADSGNSGDCTFNNCIFWGTTYYSIFINKPNFTFNQCTIYGNAALLYRSTNQQNSTKFFGCHFEDKPYNGKGPYGAYLVESNDAKYTSFTNCTFTSNIKKLCWLQTGTGSPVEEKYHLINCQFTINNNNLPVNDFIAIMRGVVTINCTFNFTNKEAKTKKYSFGDTNPLTSTGSYGSKILIEGK
jgi:hypothetical protein